MTTRKSSRLAAKGRPNTEVGRANDDGEDRVLGGRASIGGALGLTPAQPKGRNLVIAKAAVAAEAAAARLDELNAGDQQEAKHETAHEAQKQQGKEGRTQEADHRG